MDNNPCTIRERGFRLLTEGLGTVGTVKFLQQLRPGIGNYTEERGNWLDGLTIDEVADRIEKRKAEQALTNAVKYPMEG